MRHCLGVGWVDSLSEQVYPSSFAEILSPVLTWIPFVQHISGARAGLSNIYLNQAVCNPKSTCDPSLSIVPCYDESVLLYSGDRDKEVDDNAKCFTRKEHIQRLYEY